MHIYIKKSYRKENYKIVFPHVLKQNALVFFPSRFFSILFLLCENTFHVEGWDTLFTPSGWKSEVKHYSGRE